MKKTITLLFLTISFSGFAQITFQKTYGGSQGSSIAQTADGGYILSGKIGSGAPNMEDIYLIKINAAGDTLWTKIYRGPQSETGLSVRQTNDGGYIVAGLTKSFGAGDHDVLLMKTDASGDTVWTRTYGGSNVDQGFDVQQTTDGGYIVCGRTQSFGAGYQDVYVIKTNSTGDTLWTRVIGGISFDEAYSLQQTNDGGYIIAGFSYSFTSSGSDAFLIKINGSGTFQWMKTYGIDLYADDAFSVQQTADNGYVIAGHTDGSGAGSFDVFLIKTNSTGDTLWTKTYGGTGNDRGFSARQTTDGGFVVAGYTLSFGASSNAYLIKTDSNGNLTWSKRYGGNSNWYIYWIRQTNDGGYMLTGSNSFLLIKTDSNGNSGCNEANPATQVASPAFPVASPVPVVSTGCSVNHAAFISLTGNAVTTFCSTTGLTPNPSPKEEGVVIAPNPTTNNFTITFPHIINKGVIEIYNVLGEKVKEETVFNASVKEIRLKPACRTGREIPSGIYVVKVSDGEHKYVNKLIVQ